MVIEVPVEASVVLLAKVFKSDRGSSTAADISSTQNSIRRCRQMGISQRSFTAAAHCIAQKVGRGIYILPDPSDILQS
eukprot:SAG31_NODE_181_length_21114_cov_99.705211_6_plen_78_part_00